MTVAVTDERLKRTMQLLKFHAKKGLPCPTNQEIAKAIGMGTQKFQPVGNKVGNIAVGHEAGSVMIAALAERKLVRVERLGRNKRRVEIVETGQIIETEVKPNPLFEWVP